MLSFPLLESRTMFEIVLITGVVVPCNTISLEKVFTPVIVCDVSAVTNFVLNSTLLAP